MAGASHAQAITEQVAENGQLSLSTQPLLTRTTVRAGKNETVATVSRRYKASPSSVAEWNGVRVSAVFKAGQALTVYLPPASRKASPTSKKAASGSTKLARRTKSKPVQLARQ
jgi:membrane-bound lytic murein transglycosylase D